MVMVEQKSKPSGCRNGDLFWQRVLAAHAACGLTVKEYCEREGLVVWRFYYWRKKLREAT